jgi:hypothetical protein
MLRSVGVPARMAVGFAQGERDGNDYIVRRYNAHAWPEVYYPDIGWVEFEPTAGQAPLDRPLPPQDDANANPLNPIGEVLSEGAQDFAGREQVQEGANAAAEQIAPTFQPIYLVPLFAILAGLVFFLSYRFGLHLRVPSLLRSAMERSGIDVPIWVLRWENWVKLSPIEKAFESVNFGLKYLDQPVPVHITPIERATRLQRLLPNTADQIKILLDEHQTSLYTSRTADVAQARNAAFLIRKQTILERIRYLFVGKPPR